MTDKIDPLGFQRKAIKELVLSAEDMWRGYTATGRLSSLALTAPTGAGKTIICANAIEQILDDDPLAAVLWLSDSPALNWQSLAKFRATSDALARPGLLEAVSSQFADMYEDLAPAHVYFLNRQKLSGGDLLVRGREGGRTFWNVLKNTLAAGTHLYIFIDEAHRGLGRNSEDKGTSTSEDLTIYAKILDGQPGLNPPMPAVVGISATPGRFKEAMDARPRRGREPEVDVPISAVRASGLIKQYMSVHVPDKGEVESTEGQDLEDACKDYVDVCNRWQAYCKENVPQEDRWVHPLMVIQVENSISDRALATLVSTVRGIVPGLSSKSFANVFGEHESRLDGLVRYAEPEDIEDSPDIRILFAKDAVSTGWDCPRAEILYSRRRRKDPTYISQMIGRMIRMPFGKGFEKERLDRYPDLETCRCYLPDYDPTNVDSVMAAIQRDRLPIAGDNITTNPLTVHYYGNIRATDKAVQGRLPKADPAQVKDVFDHIVARSKREVETNPFAIAWHASFMASPYEPEVGTGAMVDAFYHEVEGAIVANKSEFDKSFYDVLHEKITVRKYTTAGWTSAAKDVEHVRANDEDRLVRTLDEATKAAGGKADLTSGYVKIRQKEAPGEMPGKSCARLAAAFRCTPVQDALSHWAKSWKSKVFARSGTIRPRLGKGQQEEWDHLRDSDQLWQEAPISLQTALLYHQSRDDPAYDRHIIVADDGTAHIRGLNRLERDVISHELQGRYALGWYRNRARATGAAFSYTYRDPKDKKALVNVWPDFILFEDVNGTVRPSVVDPHGAYLDDTLPRLWGALDYINDHLTCFARWLVIADLRNGKRRSINLMDPDTAALVRKATDADSLFMGPASQGYPA